MAKAVLHDLHWHVLRSCIMLCRQVGGAEGIVNGMDTTDWSPNVDKFLDVKYDADTVDEGKALAKEALQAELGLPVSYHSYHCLPCFALPCPALPALLCPSVIRFSSILTTTCCSNHILAKHRSFADTCYAGKSAGCVSSGA